MYYWVVNNFSRMVILIILLLNGIIVDYEAVTCRVIAVMTSR